MSTNKESTAELASEYIIVDYVSCAEPDGCPRSSYLHFATLEECEEWVGSKKGTMNSNDFQIMKVHHLESSTPSRKLVTYDPVVILDVESNLIGFSIFTRFENQQVHYLDDNVKGASTTKYWQYLDHWELQHTELLKSTKPNRHWVRHVSDTFKGGDFNKIASL
jgi:hypothetical protein